MPEPKGALREAVEDSVDKLGLGEINFVREALKWQYNWIGLAGAAAFAIVSGTGLPLVWPPGWSSSTSAWCRKAAASAAW